MATHPINPTAVIAITPQATGRPLVLGVKSIICLFCNYDATSRSEKLRFECWSEPAGYAEANDPIESRRYGVSHRKAMTVLRAATARNTTELDQGQLPEDPNVPHPLDELWIFGDPEVRHQMRLQSRRDAGSPRWRFAINPLFSAVSRVLQSVR